MLATASCSPHFINEENIEKKGEKQAVKFFPQWDGPYTVVDANPGSLTYMLDMDGHDGIFPIFHSSELKLHIANDETLFPN